MQQAYPVSELGFRAAVRLRVVIVHRCTCGYPLAYHAGDGGRCPLCTCGAPAAEHGPYVEPPAPALVWMEVPPARGCEGPAQLIIAPRKMHHRCPERSSSGELMQLRHGMFREPAQPRYRELWHGLVTLDDGPEAEAGGEALDRVPRRPALAPDEVAPRALALGRKAAAVGCMVNPYYRVDASGTERCIIAMERGQWRAIAIWQRPAGGKWASAAAAVNKAPVGVLALGKLISGMTGEA